MLTKKSKKEVDKPQKICYNIHTLPMGEGSEMKKD
jgi:hypothetical protein